MTTTLNKAFPGAGTYANIMYDTPFKISFGSELGKQNMINLLNCLIPDRHIDDITYEKTEQPGFFISEKKSIFDLSCKSGDDSFVVEMQITRKADYQARALFYSTFLLREQLLTPAEENRIRESGSRKALVRYSLKPVYVVSIINFQLDHASEEALRDGLVSSYSIRNDIADERMTEALHFVFLELGRMKYGPQEAHKCRSLVEKVAFAFKNGPKLEGKPEEFEDKFIKDLFHTMEIMGYTYEQRVAYEREILAELEHNSEITAAREDGMKEGIAQGMAQGMEKGIAQGIAQGMEKGMAQGMEKGMAQGMEKGIAQGRAGALVELARKMLSEGESREKIFSYTGLAEGQY